jgi:N12 class adenine-specific DNA methylase
MAYSYEEWKKRDAKRKKPNVSTQSYSDFEKQFYRDNPPIVESKRAPWKTMSEIKRERARQADADRFAGRYLSEEADRVERGRTADAQRFAGRYSDEHANSNKYEPSTPKATSRQADADRFAGRYADEAANPKKYKQPEPVAPKKPIMDFKRTTPRSGSQSQFTSHIDIPDVQSKKENTPSLLSRVFDNAKKNLDNPGHLERRVEMEHQGAPDMAKGFFNADNKNDTLSEKAGANLRLGAGDALESVAGGLRWLSGVPKGQNFFLSDGIQKGADKIRDGFEDDARKEEFELGDWKNPEWLATQLPRAIPQLLTSIIPGLAIAGVTGKLSKIQKLPKLYKTLIPAVAGGGTQAAIDATLEAGGVYDEAIRRGMTEDEAKDAGNEAFRNNFMLNSGMDIAQFALMLTPFKKLDSLGKLPSVGLRTAGGAATEAFQEGAQSGITAHALGDDFSWSDPSTIEAMLLGGILGGGVTGTVTGFKAVKDSMTKQPVIDSPVTDIIEQSLNELPVDIRQEFDQAVTDMELEGMPRHEAIEIAAEQLLERAPAFGDVMVETMKQYIKDKKMEQQNADLNPVTKEEKEIVTQQEALANQVPQPTVLPPSPPGFDASLDMPSVPFAPPVIPGQPIAPPNFETPVQAPVNVQTEPLDIQVGDSVNLQGTKPDTGYVVEAIEGDQVQVQTPNQRSISVPKSRIASVLNRKAEQAQFDEVNEYPVLEDVELPSAEIMGDVALPPSFRADLHDALKELVNEGVPIEEAVEELKADDYYADTPEWHNAIDEEARAFGYEPPTQEEVSEIAPPVEAEIEPRTQEKPPTPIANNMKVEEPSEPTKSINFKVDKFEPVDQDTDGVMGVGSNDGTIFVDVFRSTTQEGLNELERLGFRFTKMTVIGPSKAKWFKFTKPGKYAEWKEAHEAFKDFQPKKKYKPEKESVEETEPKKIQTKSQEESATPVELITPIGKNEETGRPIYKYQTIGKKWLQIPLNAPTTVNGEPNTKKAYLMLQRGIGTLHVGGDASIIQDMGTIFIGMGKNFKWEGHNISDVFPDIPEYNKVLFTDMRDYLEGKEVKFESKVVQDERKAELDAKAEQAKETMLENRDPNAIFSANKDEWNKEPFKPTHQRKIKTLNKFEQWQVVEFETAKGTFFVRRSESVPYINPAPISLLSNVLEPLSKAEPEKPSAKEPYLTILFKNEPVPKVSYKETKTRITATFKPNKKHWHKEEPSEMTLIFSKDKDGYLGMPKHDGRSASVADINDWLNLNYYSEGVSAKDLIEAFDHMNSTHVKVKDMGAQTEVEEAVAVPKTKPKEEVEYSKDFTHEMVYKGTKIRTHFQDNIVKWIDENGNTGQSETDHRFRAVKIPTGEEKIKQDALEAEIAETIKKNYSYDPFEGFPPGLMRTGIGKDRKGYNSSWTNEQARQYRLNEQTILSLMSDEDVLNYSAIDYASSTYKPDSRAYGDMELTEKWFRDKMKTYGSHNTFISNDSPYGYKNKVKIETGDGRLFSASYNEMWKRYKGLLDAYNAKNETPQKITTVTEEATEQTTSEYASLGYLEPKHEKRSTINGSFSKDELVMFDLLYDSEIPSFMKAIYGNVDPRLAYDQYLKHMVSRGQKVKLDSKEFNEGFKANDVTIEEYRKNLLGYGRGLDENGEQFQVLMDAEGTVYISYPDDTIELSHSEFEEAMKEDEYSFGKANRPAWVDDLDGFLEDIRNRQGGSTNVSNIIGTGSVSNGTPTKPTQDVDGRKPNQEVSATGDGRNQGSNERTNDGIADGVPDSREEQSEGSTGDTITSPSNHGNPTERVVPVDHVITKNIYEPNAKKRFENNIKALETLKTLEAENRHGTASELETLAKYQGWGGLPDYFDRRKPQYPHLQEHVDSGLITKEEYDAMQKTVLTSYYTSYDIVKQMYDVLLKAGFNGGKILESSVGTGMFLGAFPQVDGKHKFTTVEIDGLSHRITSKLYPNQKHHHKGFQIFKDTEGSFDVVIGNVPFSGNKILDKTYTDKAIGTKKDAEGNRLPKGKLDHKGRVMEYATHNTHDYFLVKNLDLLKEGGLGVLITSSSSLDSRDWRGQLVREYMEANTDFFEVIRLPNDAFKHAGTSVTTDILFFRKKVKGSKTNSSPITNIGQLDYGDAKGNVNEYFLANPDQITGELKQGTRYGDQLIVSMDNFERRLKKAVAHVSKVFKGKFVSGGVNQDAPVKVENFINEQWAKEKVGVFDGAIHAQNGAYFQYVFNQWKMYKVEKDNIPKLKDALAVRDSYLALIVKEENKDIPSEQMIRERKLLNETYDKFVKTHGEFNKTGVLTPFEDDVRTVALLRSLEKVVGKKLEKVDLFKDRQKFPDIKLEKKGDVKQALNLSLIHRGELDLNVVSDLIGKSKDETIDKLEAEGHIFFDPQEQAYVTDDEYLSGNIAKKLALAKAKDLHKNIAALEKIMPTQLSVEQVVDGIRFGQGWIPKEVYKEFIEKTLGLRDVTVTHNFQTASWGLSSRSSSHKNEQTYAINHKYAKKGVKGIDVIEKLMNMKSPKPALDKENIPPSVEAQTREEILNVTNRIVEQLQNELKSFIIGHPTYNEQLTRLYNDTFTSVVPRTFDGERMYGTDEEPTLIPNLNPVYKLYKHQKDAAMRVLRSQNTLLAHVVGAGKSLEMQVAIMEGRRLGIIKKPMMVVPNFMVEQASREFQHAYPNAKIKVITTGKTENDIAGIKISRNAKWSDKQYEQEVEKNRALRFRSLADVKYGDYDVVIMSYTSFERVSLDPENEREFVHREVEALRSYMEELTSEDGKSPTVKEIEKAIEKLESRLEELAGRDKKDVGMSFEEIGIDALFVDEAQSYKNLQYHTKLGSIGGLPNSSSKRAFDMYMKTFVMNKQGGRTVFATGTPISNSMAEMYTLLRYLAPEVLEAQGLTHFDGWAQLFGTTENSVELNTAGKFVEKTRFSKFTNVGELMRIFKSFADVKMADDLPYLKRPKAERITVTTGMSDKQKTYLEIMVKRAGEIADGIEPFMDNLLKLTGEGKKLALDYRLFDGSVDNDPNSKLNRIAEEVAEEYKATAKGNKGTDPNGKPFTFDNGTQIVFMDIGVPKATDKPKEDDSDDDTDSADASMYQNLKDRLLELGVKDEHIAFIHDYNKPPQKKKLSELFNDGKIRVLIGSTGKMGVGMNLQKRLTTLHHADPTWRPSDIEQREGRIIRQGNFNSNVNIKTYVTEGSFDALMWNTLENKAKFIAQVMSGGTEIRSMDEIAEQIMSFSEIKASATGNLSMIELMKTEKEIRRLTDLQRDFSKRKGKATHTIEGYEEKKKNLTELYEFASAMEGKAKSTRDKNFHFVLGKKTYTERTEGVKALQTKVLDIRKEKRTKEYAEQIGVLGGVPIIAAGYIESNYRSERVFKETVLVGDIVDGAAFGYGFVPMQDFVASEGRGSMSRLENVVIGLSNKTYSPTSKEKLEDLEVALKEAKELSTQTFEHTDTLHKLENDVISLREEALQHELTNTFDTVFAKDGKEYVATRVNYREVPSKNKKKQKEDKPDYEIDVIFSEVINITKSSEPDVFGESNETEYEIYELGEREVLPVITFVRDFDRKDTRKGVTERVAEQRRVKAEDKRQQEAERLANEEPQGLETDEDSGVSSLLNTALSGGTDIKVSPKVAKQVGDLLANALNTVIRSGYVEGRRGKKKGNGQALGTYNFNKKSGNVRSKHLHDLRVVAHELGHAFEDYVGLDTFESLRSELEKIAEKLYPNGSELEGDDKMKEGLAELFQLYVIDPIASEQLAPEAYNFLKKFIEGDPHLNEAFVKASKVIEDEVSGSAISKVLGSINFADDARISKNIGDGYSIRGGENATGREKIKGFIKEQLFEFIDFTIPFKDMRKALTQQGYKGLDIVKKLASSGNSMDRARHEFVNWSADKYGRKIINYKSAEEVPEFLRLRYEDLLELNPSSISDKEGYRKRYKEYAKKFSQKEAALMAISSRSFQEVALDGIVHIEEILKKNNNIPADLQQILDRTKIDDNGKKKKSPSSYQMFSAIAQAYRYKERSERVDENGKKKFVNNPISEKDAESLIEFSRQYLPKLENIIEEYTNNLSEVLLTKAVEGGIITKETKETVKKGSRFYIPTYYASSSAQLTGNDSERKTARQTVHGYEGKQEIVLDVLQATMNKLMETEAAVEFKSTMDMLQDSIDPKKTKGMGKFGEIIRPEAIPHIVKGTQIEKQLIDFVTESTGVDASDMEGSLSNAVFSIFIQGDKTNSKEAILMNWKYDKDGKAKRTYMRIAPDMYNAIMSMQPLQLGLYTRMMSKMSSFFRFLALANFKYMKTAFERDLTTAFLQRESKGAGTYIKSTLKGMAYAAGVDQKVVDQYMASGAFTSNPENVLKSFSRKSATDGLLPTKDVSLWKMKNGKFIKLFNPSTYLSWGEGIFRYGEFHSSVVELLAEEGINYNDFMDGSVELDKADLAKVERILLEVGHRASQVTVNFSGHGKHEGFRKVTAPISFLHGALQGIYREGIEIKEHGFNKASKRLTIRAASTLLPMTLVTWALSRVMGDDEEEIPSDMRDRYWFVWTPFGYYGIAKPFTYSIPDAYVERFLDDVLGEDGARKYYEDVLQPLKTLYHLPYLPMWLKTFTDISHNETWWGGEIVSKYDEDKPDFQQFDDNTSTLARQQAEIVFRLRNQLEGVKDDKDANYEYGISPKKFDYAITSLFGKYGAAFLETFGGKPKNDTLVTGSFFTTEQEIRSRSVDKFYKKAKNIENAHSTFGVKHHPDETTKMFRDLKESMKHISDLQKEVHSSPNLTKQDKNRMNLELTRAKRDIARFGIKVQPKDKENVRRVLAEVEKHQNYLDSIKE